jgi:hypothetical protein
MDFFCNAGDEGRRGAAVDNFLVEVPPGGNVLINERSKVVRFEK